MTEPEATRLAQCLLREAQHSSREIAEMTKLNVFQIILIRCQIRCQIMLHVAVYKSFVSEPNLEIFPQLSDPALEFSSSSLNLMFFI